MYSFLHLLASWQMNSLSFAVRGVVLLLICGGRNPRLNPAMPSLVSLGLLFSCVPECSTSLPLTRDLLFCLQDRAIILKCIQRGSAGVLALDTAVKLGVRLMPLKVATFGLGLAFPYPAIFAAAYLAPRTKLRDLLFR